MRPRAALRRGAKGLWAFLLALALFFTAGSTFGTGDAITEISKTHLYSVARWEVGNFLKKWTAGFADLFAGGESREEQLGKARLYFRLTEEIEGLEGRVRDARGGFTREPDLPALEEQLDELTGQRDKLEPDVEELLESLITSYLKDAGVSSSFLGVRLLWPPVDFRLDEVPKLLVVSPRERIANTSRKLLDPDITLEEREELEAAIDARDLSSLVVSIGGVATYPSLIPDGLSLRSALRLAAHEWTHHYLFFHALGRGYNANGDMTTLNETVADIVGDELGGLIYREVFATPQELAARNAPRPAADVAEDRFDFGAFMRETRVHVDELLAAGRVDVAEAYMEERRLELAENGYFFRKLNQAFFAFHGSYAARPSSPSPIGGQVRSVREASEDLGDFLGRVGGYASYDSLVRDLPMLSDPAYEG